MNWWRDLTWFNLDFGKRWGLPIVVLAIGIGAVLGAVEWRFSGAKHSLTSPRTITVTATPTQETVQAPAETKTVVQTVTLTPPVAQPDIVTRVREVAIPAQPNTVTKTVEAEPKTTTVTVTETPDRPGKGERGGN